MRAWSAPEVPALDVTGPAVRIHDTATGGPLLTDPQGPGGAARLYVCGITPYDATHLGHAATYVAFDLLVRAWRAAGHDVDYVQNVTDVDDPLLERADKIHLDWVELAERETELFRQDMTALRVLPPAHFVGAVESIPRVIDLIEVLDAAGAIYRVEDDLYFSVTADPAFGDVSGWDREQMLEIVGQRGGDPERPGKKDPLDCVVWRGERPGEPSWESPFGPGRPGWHIECTAIAREHLGTAFDVQGGGSDLVFPHHEMCAGEGQVAEPGTRFALAYAHAGMVAYDGEKMSKSKGNLVFVSALRNSDVDPMAIRLVLLRHHYRNDWEWTDDQVWAAVDTLADWRKALSLGAGAPARPVVEAVLAALAHDLDAPTAVLEVQAWVDATLGVTGHLAETSDPAAADLVRAVLDASLGLAL
ncbi:MAG: cysteine--1-D-myo-inosityl 2-amino-2-deoxy-alpha-D-glucopyranoside ligase [Nocardioides sp.]